MSKLVPKSLTCCRLSAHDDSALFLAFLFPCSMSRPQEEEGGDRGVNSVFKATIQKLGSSLPELLHAFCKFILTSSQMKYLSSIDPQNEVIG